jgi:hypothetical protein
MAQLQLKAYSRGRSMIWSKSAALAMEAIQQTKVAARPERIRPTHDINVRPLPLDGILRLCDGTGIMQHSCYSVPDRAHGYCIDDNARALMLMNRIDAPKSPEALRLGTTFDSRRVER